MPGIAAKLPRAHPRTRPQKRPHDLARRSLSGHTLKAANFFQNAAKFWPTRNPPGLGPWAYPKTVLEIPNIKSCNTASSGEGQGECLWWVGLLVLDLQYTPMYNVGLTMHPNRGTKWLR